MLIDRPQITETSTIVNATVPSGTSFPSAPSIGELFFRTDLGSLQVNSTGTNLGWADTSSVGITTHTADLALHLTAAQNILLDGLTLPSLTAADINQLVGLNFYLATQSATSLSARLTAIDSINTSQSSSITTLNQRTQPGGTLDAALTGHIANNSPDAVHLTNAQKTFLNALTVSATELNYSTGVTSNIQSQFTTLNSNKLNTSGGIISGNLTINGVLTMGGTTITGVATPVNGTDVVNKSYADSVSAGLTWKAAVKAATTANILLEGLLTVDDVALTTSDRVLVKNQTVIADNGVYLAAAGPWSRAPDVTTPVKGGTAIYVQQGTQFAGTAWIHTDEAPEAQFIQFGATNGLTAGNGISVGGYVISVNPGNGLTFSGSQLIANTTARLPIVGGQIDLQTIGSATSAGNSSTIPIITIDAYGRVTSLSGQTITASPALTTPRNFSISGGATAAAVAFNGTADVVLNVTDLSATSLTTGIVPSGRLTGTYAISISGNAITATNATTATTLATARTINGVSFNGSANITVTAAADTLTGTTLNSTVTASSLTTVGTLSALAVTGITTHTGAANHAGTASPIQLQGLAGTAGQVMVSAGVGATPIWTTLSGANFTNIPNSSLTNSSITIGTTSIALGASATTIAGLASVTSTTFIGSLSGNATTATTSSTTNALSAAALNTTNIWNAAQVQYFNSNINASVGLAGQPGGLNIYQTVSTKGAVMSFHRNAQYAVNFGLDSDNVVRLGGWSDGTTTYRWTSDQSGNFVARGNVSAFSDKRLKTDIEPICDALDKVQQLNGVTFKRVDTGEFGTGLIAQDVEKVMNTAVQMNDNGMLSVSYGNLVGLLVEAIKELREEVTQLKKKIDNS